MAKVIGVKFRNTGKTYFFDPKEFELAQGDHVVVETAKGIEYGLAVSGVHEVDDRRVAWPLRSVIRKATERDDEQVRDNERREKEAFGICLEKIAKHGLEMKLTEVEYSFDNSKILFYFTADGRVDFRELVKDLASVFRTRIELRQIGVRDEARAIGGYGSCGRPLCCTTYLNDFVPVSIKMAKEQNLSLNPQKISGVCGRLMCCLNNEEETYEELNKTMPSVGDIVAGSDGAQGEVQSINILRQTAKVLVEVGGDKELRDYEAADLTYIKRKRAKKGQQGAEAQTGPQGGQTGESAGQQEKGAVSQGGSPAGEPGARGGSTDGKDSRRSRENARGRDARRDGGQSRDGSQSHDGNQNRDGSQNRDGNRNNQGRRSRHRSGSDSRNEQRDNRDTHDNRGAHDEHRANKSEESGRQGAT